MSDPFQNRERARKDNGESWQHSRGGHRQQRPGQYKQSSGGPVFSKPVKVKDPSKDKISKMAKEILGQYTGETTSSSLLGAERMPMTPTNTTTQDPLGDVRKYITSTHTGVDERHPSRHGSHNSSGRNALTSAKTSIAASASARASIPSIKSSATTAPRAFTPTKASSTASALTDHAPADHARAGGQAFNASERSSATNFHRKPKPPRRPADVPSASLFQVVKDQKTTASSNSSSKDGHSHTRPDAKKEKPKHVSPTGTMGDDRAKSSASSRGRPSDRTSSPANLDKHHVPVRPYPEHRSPPDSAKPSANNGDKSSRSSAARPADRQVTSPGSTSKKHKLPGSSQSDLRSDSPPASTAKPTSGRPAGQHTNGRTHGSSHHHHGAERTATSTHGTSWTSKPASQESSRDGGTASLKLAQDSPKKPLQSGSVALEGAARKPSKTDKKGSGSAVRTKASHAEEAAKCSKSASASRADVSKASASAGSRHRTSEKVTKSGSSSHSKASSQEKTSPPPAARSPAPVPATTVSVSPSGEEVQQVNQSNKRKIKTQSPLNGLMRDAAVAAKKKQRMCVPPKPSALFSCDKAKKSQEKPPFQPEKVKKASKQPKVDTQKGLVSSPVTPFAKTPTARQPSAQRGFGIVSSNPCSASNSDESISSPPQRSRPPVFQVTAGTGMAPKPPTPPQLLPQPAVESASSSSEGEDSDSDQSSCMGSAAAAPQGQQTSQPEERHSDAPAGDSDSDDDDSDSSDGSSSDSSSSGSSSDSSSGSSSGSSSDSDDSDGEENVPNVPVADPVSQATGGKGVVTSASVMSDLSVSSSSDDADSDSDSEDEDEEGEERGKNNVEESHTGKSFAATNAMIVSGPVAVTNVPMTLPSEPDQSRRVVKPQPSKSLPPSASAKRPSPIESYHKLTGQASSLDLISPLNSPMGAPSSNYDFPSHEEDPADREMRLKQQNGKVPSLIRGNPSKRPFPPFRKPARETGSSMETTGTATASWAQPQQRFRPMVDNKPSIKEEKTEGAVKRKSHDVVPEKKNERPPEKKKREVDIKSADGKPAAVTDSTYRHVNGRQQPQSVPTRRPRKITQLTEPPAYYQKQAQRLRREADVHFVETASERAGKYVEAGLMYLRYGAAIEAEAGPDEELSLKKARGVYGTCMEVFALADQKFTTGSRQEVLIIAIRCLAVISMKIFNMRLNKTAQEHRSVSEAFKKVTAAMTGNSNQDTSPWSVSSGSGSNASPSSPSGQVPTPPDPASTAVGNATSNNGHSSASTAAAAASAPAYQPGMVPFPKKVVSLGVAACLFTNYALEASRHWNRADRKMTATRAFFANLNETCGEVHVMTNILQLLEWGQTGLNWSREAGRG